MEQLKWFDRTFAQATDPRLLPSLVERLMGTPARLEEKLAALAPEQLTVRVANTWSIQENAGHLADLEPLWQGRLADILADEPELHYDAAFRAEALRLASESRSTQAAARALNSNAKLLYKWQKEALTPVAAARGAELDPATAAELRQLRALPGGRHRS